MEVTNKAFKAYDVRGVYPAEVNEELDDSPELLNSDPYEAWIMKIEHITDFSELLSAEEYEAFTKEEH